LSPDQIGGLIIFVVVLFRKGRIVMSDNLQNTENSKRHSDSTWDEDDRYGLRRDTEEQVRPEELDPNYRILRRRGDAKPPRTENVPIGMSRCPECGALVPRSRLNEHIQKIHGEQEDVGLEKCPVCNAKVRSDRLEKHIQKVHPDA
jgi:endogenous inhibitor of DNA gyrase (YacG/DUF329 family)